MQTAFIAPIQFLFLFTAQKCTENVCAICYTTFLGIFVFVSRIFAMDVTFVINSN